MKTVYYDFYSKLTNHLGSQRDIFVAIISTLITFSIVFFILVQNKKDLPFLNPLDIPNQIKTTSIKEKQRIKNEKDEEFYNSYKYLKY